MSRKQIPDNAIIEVFNNQCNGSIGYTTDKISRVWNYPNSTKKIKMEELYEAWNVKGGRSLFESGALLIKDNEAREALGLEPLDEYLLTLDQTRDLLINGSLEQLENVLQYCSNFILENIIDMSVGLPITDMTKANLIKKYSGKDILLIMQEREEDDIKNTQLNSLEEKSKRQKRTVQE